MRQGFRAPAALAAVLSLLLPGLALAQANSVRGPLQEKAQDPVRLEFREGAPAQTPAAAPAKAPARAKDAAAPAKFPNIDTAKSRQDYDMATPKADGIRLGRDEATGDTVTGTTPPKKPRQPDPYQSAPIKVEPVVPWRPGG